MIIHVGGSPSPFSFEIEKEGLDGEGWYVGIYYEGKLIDTNFYPTMLLIERAYPKFPKLHTS